MTPWLQPIPGASLPLVKSVFRVGERGRIARKRRGSNDGTTLFGLEMSRLQTRRKHRRLWAQDRIPGWFNSQMEYWFD
jgi:hypothetical protein